MSDITIRQVGRTGRITFSRPKALNALSPAMAVAIERALDGWADDPAVAMVVVDAEGERAFCAGGDIAEIYAHAKQGDDAFARSFWRQEYRMNARIAGYSKPIASFMQGFTMGGGVGVGCHASHRVVGESSCIAMPECGIGLIPDVGGTLLLARAPGALGEYLALTASRLSAADAVYAGFADYFAPEADWPALIAELETTGDPALIARAAAQPGVGAMERQIEAIDHCFRRDSVAAIVEALEAADGELARKALESIRRNAPLAMACALTMIRAARGFQSVEEALAQEFRFTFRAQGQGDFIEGVRAQIVEKDRNPRWAHAGSSAARADEVAAMLAPLGADELDLGGEKQ